VKEEFALTNLLLSMCVYWSSIVCLLRWRVFWGLVSQGHEHFFSTDVVKGNTDEKLETPGTTGKWKLRWHYFVWHKKVTYELAYVGLLQLLKSVYSATYVAETADSVVLRKTLQRVAVSFLIINTKQTAVTDKWANTRVWSL